MVSPKELEPVPIINLSKFLLRGIEFINLIFSEIEINWDCPVLPNKTTP